MPSRTEWQNARRTPRPAGPRVSGAGKAACRITIVASISGAGILEQYAQGRISRVGSFWERSMQFEDRLPRDRSSRRLINQRDQIAIFLRYSAAEADTRLGGSSAASALCRPPAQDRLNGDGGALRTWSDDGRSRRTISAAASGVMAKAVGGLAACGEIAFPRLLFAVMSWTMTQALAGCIAYAEAMYSVDLSELPVPRQTRSSAVALEAAHIVPSEMAPSASLGWRASIESLLAKFRSSMSRGRDRRLAIAELRALDNRMPRDLGNPRCDIEFLARRGDVRE
jgi:hypothetical protein